MEAYLSDADELFYGGAAGGGKSDLAIGLALTAHRESIIYRREFPQLKAIIRRTRKLMRGYSARYNGQEKVLSFGDDRFLEYGAVQYEDDWEKYQGRPHDLAVFDELPHFLQSKFRALKGWVRTDVPGQRTRVVATGNPPTTPEGRWVVVYFAPWLDPAHPNPAQPGELRWYVVIEGVDVEVPGPKHIWDEKEHDWLVPRSRTFIPALVDDNAYYVATGYKSTLQALPEPLRSQMLYGDFNAGVEDDAWQVIPTAWVQAAMERGKSRSQPEIPMTGLGADIARGGKDKVVLAPLYGNWFAPLRKFPGKSTPDGFYVATLVVQVLGDERPPIGLDIIGVGSSPYDILTDQNFNVLGINFSAATTALDKAGRLGFTNVRAEAYWGMREALDPNTGDDIALPNDPELLADLCAPRWSLRTTGILVESKDDIIKRLGRSPDCGDAVVMARYGALHGNQRLLLWG